MACRKAACKLTQEFLQGQLAFSHAFSRSKVLDTLDHFDYDSACTMILNLESRASVAAIAGFRRALIWFETGRGWDLQSAISS